MNFTVFKEKLISNTSQFWNYDIHVENDLKNTSLSCVLVFVVLDIFENNSVNDWTYLLSSENGTYFLKSKIYWACHKFLVSYYYLWGRDNHKWVETVKDEKETREKTFKQHIQIVLRNWKSKILGHADKVFHSECWNVFHLTVIFPSH